MKCNFPSLPAVVAALLLAATHTQAQDAEFAVQREDAGMYRASLGDAVATSHLTDHGTAASFAGLQLGMKDGGGKSGLLDCDEPGCGKGCGCASCQRGLLMSRAFGSLEYLHWYSKDRTFPALVTTSPANTPALLAGRLDQPDTRVLFGGDQIGGDLQAGARLHLGLWLDDCRDRAIGMRIYGNEGEAETFAANSTGDPILARPFFDTNPLVNNEAAFLVAFPGLSQGTINASATNQVLGGELYGRTLFDSGCNYRLDLLGGYRFNRIDDDLVITSVAVTPQPVTLTMTDVFDVHNEYHAGEFGLLGEFYRDCWTITVLGKIGVGNMNQQVTVAGNFETVGGGGGVGGLLAQSTNIGVYERDLTVWSPEASVKLGYAVTDQLSVSVGYTFLYWTRVALAGDQIDRNLNSAQITNGNNPFAGPQDPQFTFRDTDFWVQTIDIGVNFNY